MHTANSETKPVHTIPQFHLRLRDRVVRDYHNTELILALCVIVLREKPKAFSKMRHAVFLSQVVSNLVDFRDRQNGRKRCLESERPGRFKYSHVGNPTHQSPPKVGLTATMHYFDALELRNGIAAVHRRVGGRETHRNCLAGGVPGSAFKNGFHGGAVSSNVVLTDRDIHGTPGAVLEDLLHLPRGAIIPRNLNDVPTTQVLASERLRGVDHDQNECDLLGTRRRAEDDPTEARFGPCCKGTDTTSRESDDGAQCACMEGPLCRGPAIVTGWPAGFCAGNARQYAHVSGQMHLPQRTTAVSVEAVCPAPERLRRGAYCHASRDYLVSHLKAKVNYGEEGVVNAVKCGFDVWPKLASGLHLSKVPFGVSELRARVNRRRCETFQRMPLTQHMGSLRYTQSNIGAHETSLINTRLKQPAKPFEVLPALHTIDPGLTGPMYTMSRDSDALTPAKVH